LVTEAAKKEGGFDLAMWLVPLLAATFIRLLRLTMRLRHVDRGALDALEAAGRNYILAFWHGRLLLMPYSYRGKRMVTMISKHRDGEFIARTMQRFGHGAVRGSSTRGATAALKALVRHLRLGDDAGVTPDGPKGPRGVVQPGTLMAARLAGVPIVPVSFGATRARNLASWDRFLVPMPFSRGTFFYGQPLNVPRDADSVQMEDLRLRLEQVLTDLTRRADALQAAP
jgi:lysophospholipid acyltransferase (LPLAT)-like uncharacterized protein